ncbi:hypothetical protein N7510_007543 [Penicillium lagena]|uniref:uncharacterized protein n=1 Tax=Penicillium lagena TaxID=94218 RepID=UPI00253F78AC|nr:uncharacterized protein N7510_007543 [Penicillium lagena]KAJ5610824.1 hypothetical protein N7510_007543 [Penicillium lagena]
MHPIFEMVSAYIESDEFLPNRKSEARDRDARGDAHRDICRSFRSRRGNIQDTRPSVSLGWVILYTSLLLWSIKPILTGSHRWELVGNWLSKDQSLGEDIYVTWPDLTVSSFSKKALIWKHPFGPSSHGYYWTGELASWQADGSLGLSVARIIRSSCIVSALSRVKLSGLPEGYPRRL